MKGMPAVYGLQAVGGTVVYVGRTRNLAKRVQPYLYRSCHNRLLSNWLLQNEGNVELAIFCEENCRDTEAELIRTFGSQLLNLTNGHEDTWRAHKSFPWMVGTGIRCPSDIIISSLKSRRYPKNHELEAIKRIRSRMTLAQRCLFEISLCRDNLGGVMRHCEKWLNLATPKLIAILEA